MGNEKLNKAGLAQLWGKITSLVDSKVPLIMEGTLRAGEDSIVFTNSKIKPSSRVRVSTDKKGLDFKETIAITGEVLVSFAVQPNDVTVLIEVI